MKRIVWPLVFALICLPVVLLASGLTLPWLGGPPPGAAPRPVPGGDQEIAWFHTTTNGPTWERFVTGVARTQMTVPGLHVDDSKAFLDTTTGVPELVLTRDGVAGAVRIRWYKLQHAATTCDWVKALAARRPAPLAVIGGGSTDRALDLARAMAAQAAWQGDRPPLLVTTATADFDAGESGDALRLADIYDDRTFRFCFTNRQMADAVVDHALGSKELALPAAGVTVLGVDWADDSYSVDLLNQFGEVLSRRSTAARPVAFAGKWRIPFSVGGLVAPNVYEAEVARDIARRLEELPDEKVLLVLSAVTQPARRLLRAVLDAYPRTARRVVAVTGDGIPTNAVLRDGEFAWPAGTLPVPLVFFAHNNPVAWDGPGADPPAGYAFAPPNGTEEATHFGEMGKVVAEACFPPGGPLVARGDDLIARLQARTDFFDPNGERLGGTREHVLVLTPRPAPALGVWRRDGARGWTALANVPVGPRKWPAAEGKP